MVHTHLVTWQEFMREKENKDLPILEAKAKYLKLQHKFNLLMEAEVAAYNAVALNSVMDGSQSGDPSLINPITNIVFSAAPVEIETGNDPVDVTATFQYPVLVTGSPSLKIANGQEGGGTASRSKGGSFGGSRKSNTGSKKSSRGTAGSRSKGGTGTGQSRSGGTTGRTASKASKSRTGRSRSQCDIRTKIDIAPLTNEDLIRDDLANVAYFVKEIK